MRCFGGSRNSRIRLDPGIRGKIPRRPYEIKRLAACQFPIRPFRHTHGRSAARYAAVRQSLGEPDPFRLRSRPHRRPCPDADGSKERSNKNRCLVEERNQPRRRQTCLSPVMLDSQSVTASHPHSRPDTVSGACSDSRSLSRTCTHIRAPTREFESRIRNKHLQSAVSCTGPSFQESEE